MLNLFALHETQLLIFGLILMRMIAFVMSSAVYGSPIITGPVKILLSLVLTMVLYPIAKVSAHDAQYIGENLIELAAREILVGLTIGFLSRFFFFALSMVGELISVSIGLSAAQLYNPMMGSSGNTLEQFHVILGTLLFLVLQGHHLIISAMASSLEIVPIAQLSLNFGPYGEIAFFVQKLFEIMIKMSAPVLVTILIVNIAMGILGRAIPQMNVLVTSMPVTLMAGFFVMIMIMPLMILEMNGVLDITAMHLLKAIKAL